MDVLQEALAVRDRMRDAYYFMLEFVGKLKGEDLQHQLYQSNIEVVDFAKKRKEEQTDMPRPLKFGQGSIIKRSRQKKSGELYQWYEMRFTDEYGIRHSRTFKTKNEALAAIQQVSKRNKKGTRKEVKTFGNYIQEWFDTFKKKNILEATAKYNQSLIDGLPAEVAKTPLPYINDQMLQKFLNGIEKPRKQNDTKKILCACLKRAFLTGRIKIDYGALLVTEKYVTKKREILSREKEAEFIAAIPATYRNFVIGYLYTGCRLSELLRIEAGDVDRINNTITIKGANKGRGATKEYRLRKIPLLPEVANIEFPLPAISKRWFEDAMRKACEKVGIKITPHSLRHTFATRCREAGVEPKTYSEWLGHKNVGISLDLYAAHTTPEMFKQEAEKLKNSTPNSTPNSYQNGENMPDDDL